jgi:hypothetical protein
VDSFPLVPTPLLYGFPENLNIKWGVLIREYFFLLSYI